MTREKLPTGIREKRLKCGRLTWEAWYIRANGQRRWKAGFDSLARAQVWREENQARVRFGLPELDDDTRPVELISFEDLSARWIEAAKAEGEWAPATERSARDILRVLNRRWGSRPARAITASDFSDWLVEMARAGRGARTRQSYRGIMGAVFRWARRRELVDANPMELVVVKKPKGAEEPERALSLAEVRAFLAAETRHALLWRVLLLTGLRRAEAYRARWDWLDLDAAVLHVRQGKTGYHAIPLAACLVESFRAVERVEGRPAHGYVFSVDGLPRRCDVPMSRGFRAAGISEEDEAAERLGYHTFRRTYASLLEDVPGVKPSAIRALLRHSSKSGEMSNRYKIPQDSDLRKGIAGLERLIFEGAEGLPRVVARLWCGENAIAETRVQSGMEAGNGISC